MALRQFVDILKRVSSFSYLTQKEEEIGKLTLSFSEIASRSYPPFFPQCKAERGCCSHFTDGDNKAGNWQHNVIPSWKWDSRQNHFPLGRHPDTLTLRPPSHIINPTESMTETWFCCQNFWKDFSHCPFAVWLSGTHWIDGCLWLPSHPQASLGSSCRVRKIWIKTKGNIVWGIHRRLEIFLNVFRELVTSVREEGFWNQDGCTKTV